MRQIKLEEQTFDVMEVPCIRETLVKNAVLGVLEEKKGFFTLLYKRHFGRPENICIKEIWEKLNFPLI